MAKYLIGIIGCGLIGNKRAEALKKFPDSKLVKVSDVNFERAKELAAKFDCEAVKDWHDITKDDKISIIIVSTTNDVLADITMDALKNNKHVLVEKPSARNFSELQKVVDLYESLGKKYKVKVGFNHRFHPSFEKAKEIIAKEKIGDVMFIRARYGHGGRLGYDKEWRAKKEIAGGGELLDQGVHIIDLSRYFIGEFQSAIGYCNTFFWDMEVEDNSFVLLKTKKGQIAQLHASCTQWKNIFSMEIFCRTGQINIDGLGRSYGKETLTFYKMKPEMGIPDKFVYDWDTDDSWEKEYANLLDSIENDKEPNGSLYDALAALKIVFDVYDWNKKHGGI